MYNPNKPNRYHLKAFCFNDSANGYTSRAAMFKGAEEDRPEDVSTTAYPVLNLTTADRYHHRNHICGLDNWYMSIALALALLHRGIHSVGTVKSNRTGLPAEGKFSKRKNAQPRGDIRVMKARLPAPLEGFLYFTAWQDNKPVHVLSTFEPVLTVTHRRGRINGRWERVELPMPSSVAIYNDAMGGTDLCDQYSSYYEFEHRTTKWHRRIFTHFMTVALRNAHILYLTDPQRARLPNTRSFRTFVEIVICQLLGLKPPTVDPDADSDADSNEDIAEDVVADDSDEDEDDEYVEETVGDFAPVVEAQSPPVTSRAWWTRASSIIRRLTGREHWPVQCQKQCLTRTTNGEEKRVDSRNRCYVCHKKTSSKCISCNVTLCCYGEIIA